MKESDIVHHNGDYWVANVKGKRPQYTVYRDGTTYATADSSFRHTQDGLALAIWRCNYLAERAVKN